MNRRSFAFSTEIEEKLKEIQQIKSLGNLSEAFRFCVNQTHENILFQPPAELLTTLEKNSIILRYLLIEIVKLHGGKTQVSQAAKQYLQHINKEISEHLNRKMGE